MVMRIPFGLPFVADTSSRSRCGKPSLGDAFRTENGRCGVWEVSCRSPSCRRSRSGGATFLAMRILWTSSGPSARRRVRAPRYMPARGRSLDTPAAAPHLDGPVDHPVVGGGHEHLDGRDVGAGVAGRRRPTFSAAVDGHEPGRLDVHVALGDEALDELLVLEQPAVHLAGQGALDHQVEGPPHLPDRVHAVVDAAGAEPVLGGLVAAGRRGRACSRPAPARSRT